MTESKKFTEDELSQIKHIQNKYAEHTTIIGQLYVQKELLNRDLNTVENDISKQWDIYNQLQEQEKQLASSLKGKYGDGSLDLETGLFTPAEKNEETTEKTA